MDFILTLFQSADWKPLHWHTEFSLQWMEGLCVWRAASSPGSAQIKKVSSCLGKEFIHHAFTASWQVQLSALSSLLTMCWDSEARFQICDYRVFDQVALLWGPERGKIVKRNRWLAFICQLQSAKNLNRACALWEQRELFWVLSFIHNLPHMKKTNKHWCLQRK